MLCITDTFSLNSVSNKGEGFDAIFRCRRIPTAEVAATVKALMANHKDVKSLLTTKKAADEFSKILGTPLTKFSSKLFTIEDFMKVNRTTILLYGEFHKNADGKGGEYCWYLLSIPENADKNQ